MNWLAWAGIIGGAGVIIGGGYLYLFFARVGSDRVHVARETGTSVHGFSLRSATGAAVPCHEWAGQVVLLVNTASKCGYTKQYDALQALHNRFAGQGLRVVAIPTNDFLRQDPGSDAEIQDFCRRNHGVTFAVMAKESVSDHPLLVFLQEKSPVPGKIPWNFTKYLIGPDGTVSHRFDPKISPDDPRLITAIEAALKKTSPVTSPATRPATL